MVMKNIRMDRIERKNYPIIHKEPTKGEHQFFLGDPEIVVKINPFKNLLELVKEYYEISRRNSLDELDAFLDNKFSDYKGRYPKIIDAEDMTDFISMSIFDSVACNNSQNTEWMDFDYALLDALLEKDFFKEYNKKVLHRAIDFKKGELLYEKDGRKVYEWTGDFTPDLGGMTSYARDYGMLELYTFTKLQAQAAKRLSENRTTMLWWFWCYDDVIQNLYECKFYECIATVYQKYGKTWFSNSKMVNTRLDPILYKWATYGVFAAQQVGNIEERVLKNDLVDLLSEFILSSAMADRVKENQDIIDYLKECITNFSIKSDEILQEKLLGLRHENVQLKKDNETLQKNYNLLREQIDSLQLDQERTDEEKIDAILSRIYTFMPEDINFDQSKYKLTDIWEKFAPITQKDIKTSLAIYEKLKTPDIASFLFVSSLEREMNLNFFEPFKKSPGYKKIKNTFCRDNKLLDVHKALFDKSRHPTLGNIPFVRKAISSQKNQQGSEVVAAFNKFLGSERENFCRICDAIEKYHLGIKKYTLVKLRNGLAHGDVSVKEGCDESCYNDLVKMFYEPPIQIMFSVIAHSKKI